MVSSLICHVSLAAHKQEGAETYLVVGSVDKNLVKDLEETGDKGGVTTVNLILLQRTYRLTIIFVVSSYTHIIWVMASTDPMYESGRLRTCSSCDSCESA